MKKTLLVILTIVFVITGSISCSSNSTTTKPGGAQTSPPPGQTPGTDFKPAAVSIEGLAFVPASITVAVGTTITWTNNDSVVHTVTSDTGAFDSKNMAKGSTFSHTFTDPGVYSYHCTLHPYMKGTITVQ
jgi:plastocyanin